MPRSFFAAIAAAAVLFAALHAPAVAGPDNAKSAHDFTFTAIDGSQLPMKAFDGKVVLIVNTASFCGFTKQYEGLQALHETYKDRGFAVVGVPSNDFSQEPKSDGEIKEFCEGIFGVTFPLASKTHVTGDNAHPFYNWARDALGPDKAPRWNFHKYLIDGQGRLVASFATPVAPSDDALVSAVKAELEKLSS